MWLYTAAPTCYLNTKNVFQDELKAMIDMGIIKESHSDWNRVSLFLCGLRVRAVSPHIDELLNRLGTTHFYSTLDLTKEYWQIPLTPISTEKSTLFHIVWVVWSPSFNVSYSICTAQSLLLI